jgi:hypothetical protein
VSIIVIEFITLDGVVSDPGGTAERVGAAVPTRYRRAA